MKRAFVRFMSLERSERLYAIGLILLFVGLAVRVSVATALIWTGGVVIAESVLTSYMAGLINARSHN